MFSTFYHLNNYQWEVWSLINKFHSFDLKFIPHTKNSDTSMLIDEASKLNLYDNSIYMKFFVETYRPLIPSTNWRNSSDDRHISKGSIINEKQHEVFLQVLLSNQNSKIQDLLENHFGLQDTFKRTMNRSSQWKFRNLYSTSKPVVKMKPNKILATRIIT